VSVFQSISQKAGEAGLPLFQLIGINHLDLNEPELRATILKHGNQELYEKPQRAYASE
jgi:hypothetical protein